MMQEDEVFDDLCGFAVWYGEREMSVLVNWRNGRVVGAVRLEDRRWALKIWLPRWTAFYYRRRRRWPLERLGGGLVYGWYETPTRSSRELAVQDVETFFEGFCIVDTAEDRS